MDEKIHVKTGSPLQGWVYTISRGIGKGSHRRMEQVIYLSLVTASISFTFTEAKIFAPTRSWVRQKNALLGELASCGYCFGHWIAFLLVAVYRPRLFQSWPLLDYFLTALAIAWISAFQLVAICWLMDKAGK